jgi:hypothetical protein
MPVGIVATVKVGGDRKPGVGFGGANEAQDLLVAIERFSIPVLGDFEISEKSRRSIGLHLEAPSGNGATVSVRPCESASWDWSSVFQPHRNYWTPEEG